MERLTECAVEQFVEDGRSTWRPTQPLGDREIGQAEVHHQRTSERTQCGQDLIRRARYDFTAQSRGIADGSCQISLRNGRAGYIQHSAGGSLSERQGENRSQVIDVD